jgi:hypothetical protein
MVISKNTEEAEDKHPTHMPSVQILNKIPKNPEERQQTPNKHDRLFLANSEKTIKISRTRTGVPCLWESLMSFSDLKRSTVILDKDGNPKNAVFLNEDREKQALVPIELGDRYSGALSTSVNISACWHLRSARLFLCRCFNDC